MQKHRGLARKAIAVFIALAGTASAGLLAEGTHQDPLVSATARPSPGTAAAIFAGGCFWSMQSAFDKSYGVVSTQAGYTGGSGRSPNYNNYENTGHVEAVRVVFDPTRVTYPELLDVYFHHSDPTDGGGAFVDRGPHYRPVLYWYDAAQRAAIQAAMDALVKARTFPAPLAVEVAQAQDFWPAEDYHQHFATTNARSYENYRSHSGRDEFFVRIWGAGALADPGAPPASKGVAYRRPSDDKLRATLSAMQFEVTRRNGTEPSFENEYWNLHDAGIFVDVVSGEPLFSSRDKYDSGTGWPSFRRPLVPSNVKVVTDTSQGMVRDEVRSRYADSHLGHVFDDGPPPTGLRYCMDSAALRFVPLARMAAEGYGDFVRYVK